MSAPLRFGLVGAGGIAQSYVQVFEPYESAGIVGVADTRVEAARSTAEELGCPAYGSHEEMLGAASLDAALVCTPPATHHDICLHFLEREVPVLCEKPLTLDAGSARHLLEVADRKSTTLTMAAKFRYVEDVIHAKAVVTSGILGELILFENAFASRVNMAGRWNSDPAVSGGGVIIDNGTHSVDVARYLLGPIAELMAVEGKRVQGLPVEDTAQLFIRSVDGVMGTIDLSWSIDKELDNLIKVYGTHGMIEVGWRESRYRQTSSPDWVVFGEGYDKLSAMRRNVDNFCRSLRREEPLLITAKDAMASVEVVETAYASLRENHWVPVAADEVGLRSVGNDTGGP